MRRGPEREFGLGNWNRHRIAGPSKTKRCEIAPDRCRRSLPNACAGNAGIECDLLTVDPGDGQSQRLAAREGPFDYLLVGSTGISERCRHRDASQRERRRVVTQRDPLQCAKGITS
jgi:hypothetical protein